MTLVDHCNVQPWTDPLAKLRSNSDRCVGLHERRERIFLREVENSCVVSGEMVLAIKNGVETSLSLLMSNSLFPGAATSFLTQRTPRRRADPLPRSLPLLWERGSWQ